MSRLTVYRDDAPDTILLDVTTPGEIAETLRPHNIRFDRWSAPVTPPPDAPAEEVLDAYRPYLDTLMGETGAGSADVKK